MSISPGTLFGIACVEIRENPFPSGARVIDERFQHLDAKQ